MTPHDFEKEFKRLYLPVGMYVLRMVGDTDMAEDVAQEAFIRTWQALEQGAEIASIKAYIYRCARNIALRQLQGRRDDLPLDEADQVSGESDDDLIAVSERDARIWAAIDSLPEKCREIFLMSKRDGMSNAEIAEELDISVKTVKNQMTKAFSRLREALSDGHKSFFLPFL